MSSGRRVLLIELDDHRVQQWRGAIADVAPALEVCAFASVDLALASAGERDIALLGRTSAPSDDTASFDSADLVALRRTAPHLPVVTILVAPDLAAVAAVLAAGAEGYLVRDDLGAPEQLTRLLSCSFERADLRADRRQSARLAQSVLEADAVALLAVDDQLTVLACNSSWIDLILQFNAGGADLPPELTEAGAELGTALMAWSRTADRSDLVGHILTVASGDGHSIDRTYPWPGAADRDLLVLHISPLQGRRGALISARRTQALPSADAVGDTLIDQLTGLPNRYALYQALTTSLVTEELPTAVLHVDLENFQAINRAHGHVRGDELLRELGRRLVELTASVGVVGRLSGDEFLLLLPVVDSAVAEEMAKVVLHSVDNEPFRIDGLEFSLPVRIGIAVSDPRTTADALLSAAETALQEAKAEGGGHVRLFDGGLRERAEQRRQTRAELVEAIRTGQLVLHYQPVVEARGAKPVGVEALVRWQHPTRGLLPPSEFIDEAENSDLIHDLGEYVLMKACREIAPFTGLTLAVNISARQLGHGTLMRATTRALRATGLDPARLILEVTERAVAVDEQLALRVLKDLTGLGVRVHLDDFGTGYSSLVYVRQYPIGGLKIDRSFVAGMLDNPSDRGIVASVIGLAGSLGVDVVGEGVENREQRDMLARLGCGHAQGYLFGKPMPLDQLHPALQAMAERSSGELRRRVPAQSPQTSPLDPAVRGRVLAMHRSGASYDTIAAALNSEGLRTPEGARWHRASISRLL